MWLSNGGLRWPVAGVGLLVLAGCFVDAEQGARRGSQHPGRGRRAAAAAPAPRTEAAPTPLPGAENAGKPGYYTVKPGDTWCASHWISGQNWRDMARWNNLDNPNLVEVGQVLRVVPPGPDPGAVAARAVPGAGRVETRPLDAKPAPSAASSASSPPSLLRHRRARRGGGTAAAPSPAATSAAAPPCRRGASAAPRRATAMTRCVWMWPAGGAVVAGFDEGRNKGLTITGKAGDPVLAAGDGRVVYAGSSLRGYGNLMIVKHNETYLTAYAHNQVLAGQGRPGGAPRPEDRRDGLERRRARATAFRDPAPGQADRPGQAAAAALTPRRRRRAPPRGSHGCGSAARFHETLRVLAKLCAFSSGGAADFHR